MVESHLEYAITVTYDPQAGRSALLLPGRANATQPLVVRLSSTNSGQY